MSNDNSPYLHESLQLLSNINMRAAATMVVASVFIAVSTFLAKGVAGRFDVAAEGLHPLQITAGRFIFACVLWLTVIAFKRISWQKVHWRLHVVRSIFGWSTVTLVFWASSLMALADATAISFLTPVVTLVLAVVFLGEKVGIYRYSAVAIMVLGSLVLLRPGTSAFQPAAFLALGAAVTSAVESTLIKRLTSLEPRLQILVINNLIGLVIALTAAMLVWRAPTLMQLVLLAGVGLSMSVAQVFFLTSMRDGDASFVVPFMYSTLLFAGVLDFWVFGDAPDAVGLVGAAIIVFGAVFLAWREARVSRQ